MEQGLSNFTVTAIAQDPQGFLWFGTEDGLNKYDGYEFTVYKNDPTDSTSLPGQNVPCLYVDRAGILWIGVSDVGLWRYDPSRDGFMPFSSSSPQAKKLAKTHVATIRESRDGGLWIGTDNGLFRYDPQSDELAHYRHDPQDSTSLSHDYVLGIAEDSGGSLWLANAEGVSRLRNYREGRFKRYYQTDPKVANPRTNSFTCALVDRRGTVWIGTLEGLFRYDPNTDKLVRCPTPSEDAHGLVLNHIINVFEDRHGIIWIGTFGAGLWRYEAATERFTLYSPDPHNPYSISSERVEHFYEDRSGILWIATYRSGLNRYNRKQEAFTRYPVADAVYSVFESHRGEVWLGTITAGLLRYDRTGRLLEQHLYDPRNPRGLGTNYIMTIFPDPEKTDDLWLGTNRGVYRYHAEQKMFTHHAYPAARPGLGGDYEAKIFYQDAAGEIWLGTKGLGVLRLNRSTANLSKPFADSSLMSRDHFWAIAEDRDTRAGALWLGSFGNGLVHWEKGTNRLTRYRRDPHHPHSLNNDLIYSIYPDTNGHVWMGTFGGGLNRLEIKTGRFQHWKDREGLPDNFVKAILPDEHGNLWLSTDQGLARFNPATETFKNYSVKDGLLNNTFLSGASFKAEDGRLFFGGNGGAVAFYPDSLKEDFTPPPVVISDFKVFGKSLPRRVHAKPHATSESPQIVVQLSHRQNFFSFEFVALDYTDPSKNQYAYKLEGFDEDWIPAGARRYANYTNVDPGAYVFRVKGSNSDGVWNAQGASLQLFIAPPYWKTWWFRALALIIAGAALFAGYRYRVNRLLERTRLAAHLQSARETERTHLAREIHDELGQYLTCLKIDVAFLDELTKLRNGEVDLPAVQNKIAAMSELLDTTVKTVRKISTELRPAVLDSMGLLAALEWLAEDFQKRTGIHCECFLTAGEARLDRDRATAVFRIVQESLTNVMRHAQATRVTITFEKDSGHYWLEVKDNGKGIQPHDLRKRGSFGVLGMQERAHVFGGSVSITGEAGKGTTLRVKIPA